MNPFDVFLINQVFNILIAFYKALIFIHFPAALGFAIILLTVVIRMILWPLTTTQLRSSQKMASLKPHLDMVKAEHGHDKVKHQQEVSKLYKEHGVNPLAGCLPLILQIPVFIALYQVLLKVVAFDNADFLLNINQRLLPQLKLDKIPGPNFFGFNLADKPSQWSEIGILILFIPIITGLLQFIQSKMMTPAVKPAVPAVKKEHKESLEDSMAQVTSQMGLIMPLMIAFFSYGFPVGLSLYWNTFTVIGIIQQYKINGPGGIAKYLPSKWRK